MQVCIHVFVCLDICTVLDAQIEKAMNLENVVNIFQNYIGDEAADLTYG